MTIRSHYNKINTKMKRYTQTKFREHQLKPNEALRNNMHGLVPVMKSKVDQTIEGKKYAQRVQLLLSVHRIFWTNIVIDECSYETKISKRNQSGRHLDCHKVDELNEMKERLNKIKTEIAASKESKRTEFIPSSLEDIFPSMNILKIRQATDPFGRELPPRVFGIFTKYRKETIEIEYAFLMFDFCTFCFVLFCFYNFFFLYTCTFLC